MNPTKELFRLNFYDIFSKELEKYIVNSNVKISKQGLSGFVKKMTKTVIFAHEHLKIENNDLIGYHLYSQDLINLKKNPLFGMHNWFERAEDSTYHANNARGKSNGYTHWYNFSPELRRILIKTKETFELKLQHDKVHGDKKYKFSNEKCPINITTISHFRINRDQFKKEFIAFFEYINPQGSILLKNQEFIDENFVYIRNTTKADTDSLNGLGREYSMVGLLNREMRNRIFAGYTEIDMDCAIQAVLMNLYQMNTKKKSDIKLHDLRFKFPEHTKLLEDKLMYRVYFGAAFRVNYKIAKKILTQLSYAPKSNIMHTYCKDASVKTKVDAKAKSKKFIEESIELRRNALDKLYYQVDENKYFKIGNLTIGDIPKLVDEEIRVQNKKLKGNGRGKCKEDRVMFRIYELIEHQIRMAMISFAVIQGKNEIYQIHDCLIVRGDISGKELSKYIYEKMNLDINFTTSKFNSTP